MAAASEDFPNVSSFKVTIEGLQGDQFESVSGYGIDFEDVPYTAEKNSIGNKPGRKNARDIVLTRKFRQDKGLADWVAQIGNGEIKRKSGSIICQDRGGKQIAKFDFFEAWPKSWSGPTLSRDPSGNATALETIVLSVGDLRMS